MANKYNQPERGKIRINVRDKEKMPIMEVFGPTIQGEGMVIGQKTIFIRTGGCDFHCNWCDSAFTWNGTQEPEYLTGEEAAERILALAFNEKGEQICNHVTLTGGNPALLNEPMAKMIDILREIGMIDRALDSIANIEFKQIDLARGQYLYVVRIYEHPGIISEQLSNLIKVDRTTIAHAVKKLEKNGFIEII